MSNMHVLSPDKRRAEEDALGTPLAKRTTVPGFRIDTDTPTAEHDPNATILRETGYGEEQANEEMDEDAQTVAVLTEDEDDLDGVPEETVEKIKKSKRTLLAIAHNLHEREARVRRVEEWAKAQELERNRIMAEKAKEDKERAERERLARERNANKPTEQDAADPGNTSLGEEQGRMLWFWSSHDKKLRYSELSFNDFRRTYLSTLKGLSKPTEDGSPPQLAREACSFVSFCYNDKLGCGVLVLRSDEYIDDLKKVALTVSTTNNNTGKVTHYRGWTADEQVEKPKPKDEEGELILFRIDFWAFPQGASEDEIKLHLKEDYFDENNLEEKKDWTFLKAYSAPHKPKPHLAILRISERFMDLLATKQRNYADATGIGRLEYFKNPYQLELVGFGSSIYAEPASVNPYSNTMAPNDCQNFLDRLVTTHTDKQIAVPTISEGNITIDVSAKKAETYGSYKSGKPKAATATKNKSKSAYDEHPDKAAKKNARLAKQVKIRVPVFSQNLSIREVQQRQMHLVVATAIKQIGEVHNALELANSDLTNLFSGSDQARRGVPRAQGGEGRRHPHRDDRGRLGEGHLQRGAAPDPVARGFSLGNAMFCQNFSTVAEKYITVPYVLQKKHLSSPSHTYFRAFSVETSNRFGALNLEEPEHSEVNLSKVKSFNSGRTVNSIKTNTFRAVARNPAKKMTKTGTHPPAASLPRSSAGHSELASEPRNPKITKPRIRTSVTGRSRRPKASGMSHPEVSEPRKNFQNRIRPYLKANGLKSYQPKKKKMINSMRVAKGDPFFTFSNPLKLSTERPEIHFARDSYGKG